MFKFIFTCLFFCNLLTSCYNWPEEVNVASIAASTDWRIEQRCGYEGCGPLVDFLISNDLQVRVEPNNSNKEGICTIAVTFITPEKSKYTFTPSGSSLKLANGKSVISHDFTCSHAIYSTIAFKSDNYLKVPITLNGDVNKGWRYDCFILYFDTTPPQIGELYTLNLDGLKKDGEQVAIPLLHFSKGLR